MEIRDQRRWAIADEDDDGALSKIEFKHFLHPEEAFHMRDIVVEVDTVFLHVKSNLSHPDHYHLTSSSGVAKVLPEYQIRPDNAFLTDPWSIFLNNLVIFHVKMYLYALIWCGSKGQKLFETALGRKKLPPLLCLLFGVF
jgi:hypothetical protein